MKRYGMIISLFILFFFLSGCANQVRVMWTDDPQIEEERKERFKELDEYFNEKYPEKNLSEMSQDDLYEEWRSLDPLFKHLGIHKNRAPGNFSSTIDLKNQTFTYNKETYDYQTDGNEITLAEPILSLDKETIPTLVREAEKEYRQDQSYNRNFLLRTLWMPILFTIIGILSIKRPNWIWFFESGYKYKNAEPSDFSLGLNIFRGVIGIILALVYLYFIFSNLR